MAIYQTIQALTNNLGHNTANRSLMCICTALSERLARMLFTVAPTCRQSHCRQQPSSWSTTASMIALLLRMLQRLITTLCRRLRSLSPILITRVSLWRFLTIWCRRIRERCSGMSSMLYQWTAVVTRPEKPSMARLEMSIGN